jgi:hypothetical protein
MPNWNQNKLIITHRSDVLLEWLADPRGLSFERIKPLPALPDQQVNDWCCTHWGTKWDLTPEQARAAADELLACGETFFNTAWSPPIEAIAELSRLFPESGFRLDYYEGGSILHLAPHKIAGVGNVCPSATRGCKLGCLNLSGHGVYTSVQQARIRRTKFFKEQPELFFEVLRTDIMSHVSSSLNKNLQPTCRLNGTSDIDWENVRGPNGQTIFEEFPDVQFYDYTKCADRMTDYLAGMLPKNYYLTFSLTEDNDDIARAFTMSGGNVAAVVNIDKKQPLSPKFMGFQTVDGDTHDLRFLDPKGGHIIVLRAKGPAKKDKTGFVRQPE